MDKAQAAHDSFTKGVIAQFRYDDPFFIANNNIFNIAGAINEKSNLTTKFTGKFNEAGSEFVGAEFSHGYPPAIEAFQRLKLA
jgi:hypothetical protein